MTKISKELEVGMEIRNGVQRAIAKAKELKLNGNEMAAVLIGELMTGMCMTLAYHSFPKDVAMQLVEQSYESAERKWKEREAQRENMQ